MKKRICMFGLLLAVALLFTPAGAVSGDETPPPVDDQTLSPPGPGPLNIPAGSYYYMNGINFNWTDVAGADKYLLEVEHYNKNQADYETAIPSMLVSSKTSPVPPTVATIAIKKPLPKDSGFRWRVTAINTDVGMDPPGNNQSSAWSYFSTSIHSWAIIDMFPDSYSGVIDFKKGDGTNTSIPLLNWIVDYGGSAGGNIGGISSTVKFKVSIIQGKNRYSKIVAANAICSDYYFSNTTEKEDAICSTPFGGFDPALAALEPGVTYTWEVTGLDQPDPVLFPDPPVIIPAQKDTLQYESSAGYPSLSDATTIDTYSTNRPTFTWGQPAGGLPDGGFYQLVVEGYDTSKSSIAWKAVPAPAIVPGVTKIPGTATVACPTSAPTTCYWYFAKPFNPNFRYRWNVRIASPAKFGPWAKPGTAATPDDMVRNNTADFGYPIIYANKNGAFNYFAVPQKPTRPIVDYPYNRQAYSTPTVIFTWEISGITDSLYGSGATIGLFTYNIKLVRVSPAPLTQTISVERTPSPGGMDCVMIYCSLDVTNTLPPAYSAHGLPRGVYQLMITPISRYLSQQPYFSTPPVSNSPTIFSVGPLAPNMTSATYNPGTKKLSLTFLKNSSAPAADVKYRILVKMPYGSLWRWVKTGTYAGTSCPDAGTTCTLDFTVYKPGTKNGLEAGISYLVNIQEALREEGNSAANNKKWGPFGPLGGDFPVTPW